MQRLRLLSAEHLQHDDGQHIEQRHNDRDQDRDGAELIGAEQRRRHGDAHDDVVAAEHALDQHADGGSDNTAHSAGQKRAADYGGGDGIQLKAHILEGIARQRIEAEDDAGQRRAEAADGIDSDFGSGHRKPHKNGRLFISAQSVNAAAELRVLEHVKGNRDYREGDKGIGV